LGFGQSFFQFLPCRRGSIVLWFRFRHVRLLGIRPFGFRADKEERFLLTSPLLFEFDFEVVRFFFEAEVPASLDRMQGDLWQRPLNCRSKFGDDDCCFIIFVRGGYVILGVNSMNKFLVNCVFD